MMSSTTPKTHEARAITFVQTKGLARARDLKAAGIPSVALTRLAKTGKLERLGHGLYRTPGAVISENEGLLVVARKLPNAVFCLLTALQFHGLTTQLPRQVWVSMPRSSHAPQMPYPPIRMIQVPKLILGDGVEEHMCDGMALRVYGVTRTIVDCFKHRSKVGLDVALEALREALSQKKTTMDELWRQAKALRVANVMRPYLEAVV
jgi:predicted transcriptional regulator of viral defense system